MIKYFWRFRIYRFFRRIFIGGQDCHEKKEHKYISMPIKTYIPFPIMMKMHSMDHEMHSMDHKMHSMGEDMYSNDHNLMDDMHDFGYKK